jgi:hypothetical protein
MPRPQLFVSYVSEEARIAEILKEHISRDFLGMLDVFVSSDLESIAAGANWLTSLENALNDWRQLSPSVSAARVRTASPGCFARPEASKAP